METIELPCFDITITLADDGSGSIVSSLHEEPTGDHEEDKGLEEYNAAMDAIESMVLAHACAGVDIDTPEYIRGLEVAVQSCANNL